MDEPLVKVNVVSKDGVTASVLVDGIDMSNATEITYRHKAGEVPTLTVTFAVREITLDSVCRKTLKDSASE